MNNALQTELPEEPIESPEQFRDRMRAVQKDFPERLLVCKSILIHHV